MSVDNTVVCGSAWKGIHDAQGGLFRAMLGEAEALLPPGETAPWLQLRRVGGEFFARWRPTESDAWRDLGGGGILDVGCYPASAARRVAGAAAGCAPRRSRRPWPRGGCASGAARCAATR